MVWLIGAGILLSIGLLVDWLYTRIGIDDVDPNENARNVSVSERVYIESHMHNIRQNHDNTGGF
ncbi:hypothetical protein BFG57_11365 [Bacillus solimangrovi]|uniref:Uncharacterized protein n=2 Tax=Bacillus solimangrovi TaxID=1305675 RepID=A0A1E5LIA6_9BACI|nr:hypothetical protein BFG57_11365 [Bacillus solimangrovi]